MDDNNHLTKLEKAGNIGVALGKVSEGVVTIDFDHNRHVGGFLAAKNISLEGEIVDYDGECQQHYLNVKG